jgi:tRNA dimethylallyltransferase
VRESSLTPLPVVLGPTGSGKSDLSLYIAQGVDGEIVSCDSVQIYRGFDIGTAKLPPAERLGIPHHLIDIVDPSAVFTAGDYARAAAEVLLEIAARGKIPVLVGGTGFYLRSLLSGLSPGPRRDDALRSRLQAREERRPGSLHHILARLDPASASRIHPNDKNKTIRALEVRLLEGAPLSDIFERARVPLAGFLPIKIGLDPPRGLLYSRLNDRARAMFDRGLVEEARSLLAAGVSPNSKAFESLGYKQAMELLRGEISQDRAIESVRTETRRYAKRQLTWFRKEPGVHWIRGFGGDPQVAAEALAMVRGRAMRQSQNIHKNNWERN